MSSSKTNPPGVMYPTKQGNLAGNPQSSALASQQATANKAASLNSAVGGRRRIRKSICKRRGGGVSVPQYSNMQYTPQNGTDSHPNSQITQNTQTSTQSAQNARYDAEATKGGAKYRAKKTIKTRKMQTRKTKVKRRKNRKGGRNSDWNWKCYS